MDSSQIILKRARGLCAYSYPIREGHWTQQCCYSKIFQYGRVLITREPDAGSPFIYRQHRVPGLITDSEAHEHCCKQTSLCALYYHRRPSQTCAGYRRRRRALFWGDPHFVTLDKKSYTFNGLGEFTMVLIDDGMFELQARTARASGRGLATVFVAAAAKEEGTATVEGKMNSGGALFLHVNGVQQNISTLTNEGILVQGANITLFRDNDGTITALFPSGISVTFASVMNTLAIAFDGPEEFKNRTRGLLGTWNDDPSDDFLGPDGILLPYDATPQQIHYEYGLKWQISSSKSLFTYGPQESSSTFTDFTYVPMFIDNITWTNDLFRQEAEKTCGNNTNCLFDAAVTVDPSFGASTTQLEESSNQVNNELAHFPPEIKGPSVINATMNQTVEVNITAEQSSSEALVFSVEDIPNDAVLLNTSQNLIVRWKPSSLVKVEPVFIATDNKNTSSELRPLIRLCPCQNGGSCVEDEEVQLQRDSGTRFILLSCACPAGLTGQFCESNLEACTENSNPCFPGVDCVDLPPPANITGYKCGPCPSGYSGDGAICDDIDECQSNTSGCSQLCINSPGSFACSCYHGYKLDSDWTRCRDFNECAMANDCMHKCTNYPGGRNCSCFEGFTVDPTDETACIPISRCNVSDVGCEQVCYHDKDKPKCSCRKGFQIKEDNKTCADVNECTTHRHKCSQMCNNLKGSYTCSCRPGYKFIADNFTCEDIDECSLVDKLYCTDPLELCINTPGSFYCQCQQGSRRVDNACQEVPRTTVERSTITPSTLPGTDGIPSIEKDNVVIMTIRDTGLHEWTSGLDESFKEMISQIAVQYCQVNRYTDCANLKIGKSLFSWTNVFGRTHIIEGYPKKHEEDIVVAFYVMFYSRTKETIIMSQGALLAALRQSEDRLSSGIKKRISNIRAYQEVDVQSPTPNEPLNSMARIRWIVIGVSIAVIVIMIVIASVLLSRHRRNSKLCQLEKQRKRTEFVLKQWGSTQDEPVFLE